MSLRGAWGITDGSAGMMAQIRALAMALQMPLEMQTVRIRRPFVSLPNQCYALGLKRAVMPWLVQPGSDTLAPPWPKLVISCGRRGAMAAMGLQSFIKRNKKHKPHPDEKTCFIHIQDPKVNAGAFDLIVAMKHDRITGENVLKTRFALHAITPKALEEASWKWSSVFARYPKPRLAVLMGGSTNKYRLTPQRMGLVMESLLQIHEQFPGSLMITPSRRTGAQNIAMLRHGFIGDSRAYLYDLEGENPYLALLATADGILVTDDSVNMMSEAYATGKPLYLLPLPDHANTKPARFGRRLLEDGIARLWVGSLEQWDYKVDDEMQTLAAQIRQMLPGL